MRIVMLTAEYPPFHWGGVGTSSWSLANGLAERGHKVTVITRRHELPPVANHPTIEFVQVPWAKFPMAFALSFGKNAARHVISKGAGAFDAVLVQSNMTLLPKWAYPRMPEPILMHLCGTWMGERTGLKFRQLRPFSVSGANDFGVKVLSPFYDKYEDIALIDSDAVVVESISEERSINARMKKRYPKEGAHGDFMTRRPNVKRVVVPVDMRGYTPEKRSAEVRAKYAPDGGPLFIFVGRLAGRKNPLEALEIFSRFFAKVKTGSLLIVGRGNQEKKMRKRAAALGLAARVHFEKDVGVARLQELYASSDVFLFTSTWEGYGIVAVEAACSGVPVLTTAVGGMPEIIGPEVGVIYKSVDEAVEAIPRMLALEREKVAAAMHAIFDWAKIIEAYIDLLETIVREGKTRSKAA